MKSLAALTALALGLFVNVTAQASTASATVNHLQVRLIDLDLSDGIDPALTLYGPGTWLNAGGLSVSAASIEAPLGPLTTTNNGNTWSAQSFGGSLLSPQGWSATALNSGTTNLANSSTVVTMQTFFTLSANTLLLITGDFVAQNSATPGDYTGAESMLFLSVNNGATTIKNDVYDITTNAGYQFLQGGNLVQASYANLASASVDGYMTLNILATVNTGVHAPVPEPTTTALMLGGLALVAARARRRTQG